MKTRRVVLGASGLAALAAVVAATSAGPPPTRTTPLHGTRVIRPVVLTERQPGVDPNDRHVAPGEQLAFSNLTGKPVHLEFQEKFFKEVGPDFWIEPDAVVVVTVLPNVHIPDGDPRRAYKATWKGSPAPGPNLYVP